jgi:sporulation protein YlmC with PRC-barrel domain
MKDFPVDAKVMCADGPGGQSVTLIVDPDLYQVTHIVVKEEHAPHTERLVPVNLVEQTSHDLIRLACTRAELGQLDPFIEIHYVAKTPRHYPTAFNAGEGKPPVHMPAEAVAVESKHIPEGEVVIEQGMPVEDQAGQVGTVDDLLIDVQSGKITHFILHRGHLWGQKEVVLPVSVVKGIVEGTVQLDLERTAITDRLTAPTDR